MPATPTRLQKQIAFPHQILGIYVTFRCPLTCGHCGVDSHPRRQERIDPGMVLEQIERAARAGTVRMLHLNGGEPFLERSLLVAISQKAQALGLDLVITTSAHWATSLARARTVLGELPVLTQLMISTDRFHLPFVSLDVVARAAQAAVEREVLTEVGICTRTGEEDEFVDRVRAALGPDLLKQVRLLVFPLAPVGRAAALPEAHWREEQEAFPTGRCFQLNRPVLLHDGSLSACCNTLVTHRHAGDNPLKLGNCHQHGIDELLAQVDDNYYIQAIRAGGPELLAQIAVAHGADLSGRRFGRGDICHLCDVLLHDPTIQEVLANALGDPKVQQQIAIWRAAALNEPQMLTRLWPQRDEARPETIERSAR